VDCLPLRQKRDSITLRLPNYERITPFSTAAPLTAKAGIGVFAAIVLCWIGICLCIHIGASDQTSSCPNTGECNAVLQSRFARFYGISLPSIGIGFYSSLLVILLFSWATSRNDLRTLSLRISLLLAVAGAVISVVLMYLQFAVLRSFCPLCAISALLVILIVFLAFRLGRCPPLPEKRHAFQCGTLVVLSTVLFTVIEQRKTPDPVVFSIDDHAVRESELNSRLPLSLQPFYESIYNAKLAAIHQEIAQRLISEEAAKQSMSVDALLAKEVFSKINLPNVETGNKGVSSNASLNGGLELRKNINQQTVAQLTDLLREQFVARLMQQHRVSILLRRPVPPRIAIDLSLAKLSGPADAPVQLIVFSDFQCPYCAQLAAVLRQVREKFANQVQVGFRYFPLKIHELAGLAAQAAECADRQGKFWPFHDKLFSKQGSFSADDLVEVARGIGLDTARFRGCLAAPESVQPVEASYNDAVALGLDRAPSLFLNGKWVGGVLTEPELSQRITEELTSIAQKH
jgi:protein-disulfide isomerase/uncharacterized membrane protein